MQPLPQPQRTGLLKRIFTVPHTYVLLVLLVFFAVALTHLIPAGEFNRAKDAVTGKMLIVPGSFHPVASNPASIFDVPLVLFKGMVNAADIIFFVFIIAGAFEIITQTNMINAFTGRMAAVLRGREAWVVPIFVIMFSVGGFTMGLSNEVLVFVPIGILMARSIGYDVVTGMAMIVLGAGVGFTAGLFNPFSVGLAQAIAQLPLFSGLWLRFIFYIVLVAVTSLYILRYAKRIKADPSKSVIAGVDDIADEFDLNELDIPELKRSHYYALAVVVAGFGLLLWGVLVKEWFIPEMAAVFLTMGVFAGFAAGYGPNEIARYFVAGAKSVTFGALIIGLARSIFVVMNDAKILDAIVNNLAMWVSVLPPSLQVTGMYVVQTIISLVIGSSSGQAVVTMPIMVPLSDLVGISRQTAVFIFQCPDGFTNSILPTSAGTMGALSVAKIPYERWFKYMLPLELLWLFIGLLFAIFAYMVGYN